MSFLDEIQHWLLEIIGTILLLLLAYRFAMDIVTATPTLEIYWYIIGFVIAFLMMGYKGLAKILLQR